MKRLLVIPSTLKKKYLFWKGRGGYKTQEVGATHKAQETKEFTRRCPKLYDEPAVTMEGSLLEKPSRQAPAQGCIFYERPAMLGWALQ